MLKNTMNIKRYKDLLRITHGQKMFRVPDIHYKKKTTRLKCSQSCLLCHWLTLLKSKNGFEQGNW